MHNRHFFVALYILVAIIFLASCRRSFPEPSRVPFSGQGSGGTGGGGSSNPPPAPVAYPRTLKVKVLEYGTDIPLSDVESIVLSGYQPDSQRTDTNGICFFQQRTIYLRSFRKPGYWNNAFYPDASTNGQIMICPVQGFPASPANLYDYGNSFTGDSFVVRIFPVKTIQVHLKDSMHLSTCTDCNLIMTVNGMFTSGGTNYTVFHDNSYLGNGTPILLRPGIDTTFTLPVFGNTLNVINIGEDDSGNGWYGLWNVLRRDTVMVSANTNLVRLAF